MRAVWQMDVSRVAIATIPSADGKPAGTRFSATLVYKARAEGDTCLESDSRAMKCGGEGKVVGRFTTRGARGADRFRWLRVQAARGSLRAVMLAVEFLNGLGSVRLGDSLAARLFRERPTAKSPVARRRRGFFSCRVAARWEARWSP